jgi:hypothetical protein
MRYSIREQEGAFVPAAPEDPQGVLRYIQGISRLPLLFEAQPLRELQDQFPRVVKEKLKPCLSARIPRSVNKKDWINQRLTEKVWTPKGIPLTTDLTPVDKTIMLQIVSHATIRSAADRNQHVSYKVLPYEMVKQETPDVRLIPVLTSLSNYPKEAQTLLKAEAIEIIEVEDQEDDAFGRLAEVLSVECVRKPRMSSGART